MKRIILTGFVLLTGITHAQVKKSQSKPKAEKKWVNPVKLTKEERNRPYMDEVLKTRDSITPEEAERRRKNIAIGNPFKKYGYYPKIATLSKGKYLEFHDMDAVVNIGSVKYNRKTKEITEFREIDLSDPDAQPYLDTAGRWFSPDPLSEEYSSWSPYNMVLNNPISNIDPDGRQVFTDYKLLQDGTVTRKDPNDGSEKRSDDRLFATDKKGNVTNTAPVVVDKAKSTDGSIISDLSQATGYLGGMRPIKDGTVSAGYTNNVNDAVGVFNFLNNNTTDGIEFGLGRFSKGGSSENYLITTQHSLNDNTKGFNFMTQYIGGYNNLISFYHNHDGLQGANPDLYGNQWGADQDTRVTVTNSVTKGSYMIPRFFTVHEGLGNGIIEYTRFGHKNTGQKLTPANVKSLNKINYYNVK
ncbi:RHS repeat-associated core domain-containing protein [Chryseobacterium sp. MYb328]|uniref:RHS repeat-associated core domain-containing protein n=1 Tax=Chryseobacterium sp. MYb328 TaxID=2745231 RepID=UPI0030B4890A